MKGSAEGSLPMSICIHLIMDIGGTDSSKHDGFGISTQGIFQELRQNRVVVWYMLSCSL